MKDRLHIAFDAQLALLNNSLSRYTRNLVRHLSEEARDVQLSLLLFSPRSPAALRLQHSWIPESVTLVIQPGLETPYDISRFERLRRLHWAVPRKLREIGAHVFHSHYSSYPLPLGFTVVTTVHDVFQWTHELKRRSLPLRKLFDRLFYRFAHIVCDSDCTLKDFRTYLDSRHPSIRKIYPGNEPLFRPESESADHDILHSLRLNPQSYFLYVGDFSTRKDVTTLIRAFHLASTQLPNNLKLALTRGHRSCQEVSLVKELGLNDRVIFLGLVPESNLPALYRNCFAFAFPSLYEGFGFPPLEAMACGAPVITTGRSSLAEVVGDAGLRFPPQDAEALSVQLIELSQNGELRAKLSSRGLVKARQFNWQQTARDFIAFYRELFPWFNG